MTGTYRRSVSRNALVFPRYVLFLVYTFFEGGERKVGDTARFPSHVALIFRIFPPSIPVSKFARGTPTRAGSIVQNVFHRPVSWEACASHRRSINFTQLEILPMRIEIAEEKVTKFVKL